MDQLIPVQNLYYLFCYAWNRLEEGRVVDVGGVESPRLVDLFAKVLVGGICHLIRRGLDRGYLSVAEEVGSLRGRILIQKSISMLARRTPRLVCQFDELDHDTLNNQILKTTLTRLIRTEGIDPDLSNQLQNLKRRAFQSVSEPQLYRQLFQQVQIHRHNAFYNFLLSICALVYESTLPEGDDNRYRFTDILRDEKKMPAVFQAFVRNFFAIEQSEYAVTPLQLSWDAIIDQDAEQRLLPTMITDIHLRSEKRRIIIDTKYYRNALQEYHEKKSIHSDNLYQIFSYLKNSEALDPAYAHAEGVLLYPAVGEKLTFRASFQGHPIQVRTINLDQPWQDIRSDLLNILH